jgi:hypothetical protein
MIGGRCPLGGSTGLLSDHWSLTLFPRIDDFLPHAASSHTTIDATVSLP